MYYLIISINQYDPSEFYQLKCKVTIHTDVEMDNGADEKLMRDVSENCKTLNFDVYDFEE